MLVIILLALGMIGIPAFMILHPCQYTEQSIRFIHWKWMHPFEIVTRAGLGERLIQGW